MIYDIMTFT